MAENKSLPVSIRVNPLKSCDISHLGPDCAVPWCDDALYLKERPCFTLDPLFHAGVYYVQDSSAMFVGWVLRQVMEQMSGECRVLDLCAAPGGKTTDAATSLRRHFGTRFLLVSNEVIRQRASVLQDNVAIWGDPNVVVTSSDPSSFKALRGFFDIILADVPCSGEGMFRKTPTARQMWSEDNVNLCASRQRRIVADAWDALSPGGIMIYSTCTMNGAENDDNVEWIAEELGAEIVTPDAGFEGPVRTRCGWKLEAGEVRGEGQWCAVLRKRGDRPAESQVAEGSVSDEIDMFDRNGEIYAVPHFVARCMEHIGRKVNVLSAGVHAFTTKGKDRIPCADLALSALLGENDFPRVELSREDALKFLHKDSLLLADAPAGYVVVCYCGVPLGFVKNLGTRANNLHPASRRILMNVQ